jgi:hypothetical protein
MNAGRLRPTGTSIYGMLSNPALISAEQAEANALLTYGQLLSANG